MDTQHKRDLRALPLTTLLQDRNAACANILRLRLGKLLGNGNGNGDSGVIFDERLSVAVIDAELERRGCAHLGGVLADKLTLVEIKAVFDFSGHDWGLANRGEISSMLPCPICNSEAELIKVYVGTDLLMKPRCTDDSCLLHWLGVHSETVFCTAQEATLIWNLRGGQKPLSCA
jgi:hypothetical protein